MKKIFQKFFPWMIGLGLLAYLFHQYPPQKVWQAFQYVRIPLFIFYAVFYFLLVLVFDTLGLAYVLRRFCVSIRFSELLPARVVSYLLALLNYNAGQAAMAYFLKRSKNASFFKALGSILFVMVIDFFWIVLLAFLGSFYAPLHFKELDVSHWIQNFSIVFFIAALFHILFWRGWLIRLLPFKIHFRFRDWLQGKHLFQTFHEAKVSDYFKIAIFRIPFHALVITSLYFLAIVFDAHLPFFDVITTIPVVLLLAGLPLTPGGLGASQIATVEFFKSKIVMSHGNLGPEELLFAMSLVWMFANYFLKAIAGLLFLKITPREYFDPLPEADLSEGPVSLKSPPNKH